MLKISAILSIVVLTAILLVRLGKYDGIRNAIGATTSPEAVLEQIKADTSVSGKVTSILNSVNSIQSSHIGNNPRYLQFFKANSYPGLGSLPFSVEVTQYKSDIGKGYQIIFKKEQDGYYFIKSVGFGNEALTRTWEWRQQ